MNAQSDNTIQHYRHNLWSQANLWWIKMKTVCACMCVICWRTREKNCEGNNFFRVWLRLRKVRVDVGCGWRWGSEWWRKVKSVREGGGLQLLPWSVYQLARKRLQLVLSHLRPTSFLEVGWWRCDCTMFDGCLDVWGSNRCIEEGKIGGGKERENSHQGALGSPAHLVSGSYNRKNCFHNIAVTASAHSAVLSWAFSSLLHSKTSERITEWSRGHAN